MIARKTENALELVPMVAHWEPPPPNFAPVMPPPADRERIRGAYLRARFPGVIRSEQDLDDEARVIDAAQCYAEDGKQDRARELVEIALAAHPGRQAFRNAFAKASLNACDGPADRTPRIHAARIRRLLVLGADSPAVHS